MTPRVPITVSLFVAGLLSAARAQDTARTTAQRAQGKVPVEARALVVSVQSHFGDSTAPIVGAGIIVGATARELYVVTALHVVRQSVDSTIAQPIWMFFAPSASGRDSARAVLGPFTEALDVAVLRVPANAGQLGRWVPRSWDRQGMASAVAAGDPVSPVGCPNDRCWEAPTPPDRVSLRGSLEIEFQSVFVDEGSSGGALFNQWWEVVGMVVRKEPVRGRALRIDRVVSELVGWHIARGLREPAFPRGGYRMSIGGSVMLATGGASLGGRLPSGRLTLMRQASPLVSWHVGALRLAPENLAITAGMAGLDLEIRKGRFVVRPFAEAGFGRMEGRYDLGGYYVATSAGPRYVPFWHQVTADGLGIGGGLALDIVTLPRAILEITGGYWGFTPPENAPRLKTGFVGVGLRWGL